jgi:hypothetical protein
MMGRLMRNCGCAALPGCVGPFYAQLSRLAREEILEAAQDIRGEPMDQAEALAMLCVQVMGNTTTVSFAGAQGHLQLNVYKPVIIQAVLQSAGLLADGALSFAEHMVARLAPNAARIAENLARRLDAAGHGRV